VLLNAAPQGAELGSANMSEERMLSVNEFAAETGWGTDTIRGRIRAGLIKAFKLPQLNPGGNDYYRIPWSERDKWRRGN
jgi:hypothetical protein